MDKNIFDMESIICDWAWRLFDKSATWKQRWMRRKEDRLQITLDWTGVTIKNETKWKNTLEDIRGCNHSNKNKIYDKSGIYDTKVCIVKRNISDNEQNDTFCQTEHSIFSCSYTNRTDLDQKYKIKIQRTTKPLCKIQVQEGLGNKMGCINMENVFLQELLKINHPVLSNMRVSKQLICDREVFECEQNWDIDENIVVKAGHTLNAEVRYS